MPITLPAAPETGGGSLRRYLKLDEWQLALPLALAFAALFLAPLLLLVGVSCFSDDKITQPGFGRWTKFFGDPFNYKVIGDTLFFASNTVSPTCPLLYPPTRCDSVSWCGRTHAPSRCTYHTTVVFHPRLFFALMACRPTSFAEARAFCELPPCSLAVAAIMASLVVSAFIRFSFGADRSLSLYF